MNTQEFVLESHNTMIPSGVTADPNFSIYEEEVRGKDKLALFDLKAIDDWKNFSRVFMPEYRIEYIINWYVTSFFGYVLDEVDKRYNAPPLMPITNYVYKKVELIFIPWLEPYLFAGYKREDNTFWAISTSLSFADMCSTESSCNPCRSEIIIHQLDLENRELLYSAIGNSINAMNFVLEQTADSSKYLADLQRCFYDCHPIIKGGYKGFYHTGFTFEFLWRNSPERLKLLLDLYNWVPLPKHIDYDESQTYWKSPKFPGWQLLVKDIGIVNRIELSAHIEEKDTFMISKIHTIDHLKEVLPTAKLDEDEIIALKHYLKTNPIKGQKHEH